MRILKFTALSNMSNHSVPLGNSKEELVSQAGCYITAFANIMGRKKMYEAIKRVLRGGGYHNFSSPTTVLDINGRIELFANKSGNLNGRDNSMNALLVLVQKIGIIEQETSLILKIN